MIGQQFSWTAEVGIFGRLAFPFAVAGRTENNQSGAAHHRSAFLRGSGTDRNADLWPQNLESAIALQYSHARICQWRRKDLR